MLFYHLTFCWKKLNIIICLTMLVVIITPQMSWQYWSNELFYFVLKKLQNKSKYDAGLEFIFVGEHYVTNNVSWGSLHNNLFADHRVPASRLFWIWKSDSTGIRNACEVGVRSEVNLVSFLMLKSRNRALW